MFYLEGVDAMGQAQDATEPAPKRQRTFASSFGELRELHKMKDDGVIDGQDLSAGRASSCPSWSDSGLPYGHGGPYGVWLLPKDTQPRPDAERA